MKKYFFVAPNRQVKSGMSIKVWKIERRGTRLQVWWGRAWVDTSRRRVRPKGTLTTKFWDFPSEIAATNALRRRIDSKLRSGYKRNPRRRASSP
jgi:predicted DNA-binding WGR domain protein